MTSDGNAGTIKERLRRRRSNPYGSRTTAIIGGPAAAATDYGDPGGPRFQTHPLAWSDAPSRGISPEKQIRQNKGFQATTHKLSLGDGLLSLRSIFYGRGSSLNPDVGVKMA